MPGPRTTILIEGSFRELAEELADFVDNLKKAGESDGTTKTTITPLLAKYNEVETETQGQTSTDDDSLEEARDEVLEILVPACGILNTSSDREFVASYNLLIHLIRQSPSVNSYLQSVCKSLSSDLPATPTKYGLALTVLTTIFNTADPKDPIRYQLFNSILDVVSRSSNFDNLRPQLAYLDKWLAQWQAPPPKQRVLYLKVASIAREAGESEQSYDYLIRALRTFTSNEASSEEARRTSLEALKMSLGSRTHFDFEDLTSMDSILALRESDVVYFELLEIFMARGLEDYIKFKNEHNGWVDGEKGLDDAILSRKIRLLTLASLASTAAVAQSRSLPYSAIAQGLQIAPEDVEMWVIDVIRAGLVEGKLSQSTKTFLIHRSTYRVFTMSQWREVAGRLEMWKSSLTGVLAVIKQEKESLAVQREQEAKALENRTNGMGRSYTRALQRDTMDTGMD